MCLFGKNYFCQLILLFSLFLLLFMSLTTLFCTIHRSHCTVSINFYLYLRYFQQKFLNFSKISDVGTSYLWGTIEAVWDGPTTQ